MGQGEAVNSKTSCCDEQKSFSLGSHLKKSTEIGSHLDHPEQKKLSRVDLGLELAGAKIRLSPN